MTTEQQRRTSAGFTLIEIMVTVSIIAILATIALPSYQGYVRKSRRSEAMATLVVMQLQQEKWRANNNSYSSTLADIGLPASTEAVRTYYDFSFAATPTATAYELRATPRAAGGQNQDKAGSVSCSSLSINQSGDRTPIACWR